MNGQGRAVTLGRMSANGSPIEDAGEFEQDSPVIQWYDEAGSPVSELDTELAGQRVVRIESSPGLFAIVDFVPGLVTPSGAGSETTGFLFIDSLGESVSSTNCVAFEAMASVKW